MLSKKVKNQTKVLNTSLVLFFFHKTRQLSHKIPEQEWKRLQGMKFYRKEVKRNFSVDSWTFTVCDGMKRRVEWKHEWTDECLEVGKIGGGLWSSKHDGLRGKILSTWVIIISECLRSMKDAWTTQHLIWRNYILNSSRFGFNEKRGLISGMSLLSCEWEADEQEDRVT